MTFSFIEMPGLTSQKEAQKKIKENGPIAPMDFDPAEITRGKAKKKKVVAKKPLLHATNKNKKINGGKTEDEPRQNPGETAVMNPKESVNIHDLGYEVGMYSNGKMKVGKKPDGKIYLYGKSYHSHDNHKEVAKKMGMVATDHNKTIGGTRTVLSKEETQNEDMRVIHRKRLGKKPTFKKIMPHLSGVNAPKPQLNSKEWDLDEITSLDETNLYDFINNLTEKEFESLKEGIMGTIAKAPFKALGWAANKVTHNKGGNFRLSTAGRADAAENKFKKRKQYEKDKARLDKYNAALDKMNNKSLKTSIKGALPGHTTGGQKVNSDTEYQGGKTMNEMSKIRKALLDVVEKKSHGHTDSREKWDDKFKGAGAQQMKKDLEDNPKDNPIWNKEKESHDDAEKAGRAGPKQSPGRNMGDNVKKGETKIIPPGTKMKDPGASKTKVDPNVDKGKPSTNEQREEEINMQKNNITSIANAYKSMYESTDNEKLAKEHDDHHDMHKRAAERIKAETDEGPDFFNELADGHDHAAAHHKKASIMLKKGHSGAMKQSKSAHTESKYAFDHEAGQDSMAHQDAALEYHHSSK